MIKFDNSFYNALLFTPARVLEPYSWVEHIPFASTLITLHTPRLLVELGVHSGNSYNAFCQAVKTYSTNTVCYGIDTWRGDEHAGYYDDSIYTDLLTYQQENYHFSHLLKMTFDEGVRYFSEKSIDLLHIDGLHTYKEVKHDFETWLPKMSDQGVVAFHDTQVRERNFGVWKLWEELKSNYPSFEFTHGHGLGVIAVGSVVPKLMQYFFKGNDADFKYISDFFSVLGSRIFLDHSAKIQSEQLSEQVRQLAERTSEIDRLQHAVAERESQILSLQNAVAERDRQLVELEGSVTDLREVVSEQRRENLELKATTEEREASIINLSSQISAIYNSRSWQITDPLRKVKPFMLRHLTTLFEQIANISTLVKKTFHAYTVLSFADASRKIMHFIRRTVQFDLTKSKDNGYLSEQDVLDKFASFSHDPLVSIIAVNFNGAGHLPDFLESLSNQTYRNFEVIIVDNGSTDASEEIVNRNRLLRPGAIKFIKSESNLGFAEGNNIAADHAKGEFLALLNIDTRVHEDWLKELVDAIRSDGSAAAVTPKVLFWTRFEDLEISGDQKISLDLTVLNRTLSYKKFFVRSGVVVASKVECDNSGKIVISIPVQYEPIEIHISSLTVPSGYVEIKTRNKLLCRTALREQTCLEVDFSINTVGVASFIINNTGSIADSDDMPCDRGFGEYDRGQYDQKCYLPYLCGCAALVRRAAIINRKIFVSEFFAYYEDSELSRWIVSTGLRILYAPRSIVFHKHSATLSEGSSSWRYLVQRGRSIFSYNGSAVVLEKDLAAARAIYSKSVDSELMNIVADFDKRLIRRLKAGEQLVGNNKAIGIYNSYWNTRGGGESHALSIASELQQFGPIELISENDFDIEYLSKYYALDLSRCRKLVLSKIDADWTRSLFLFINSTYASNFLSRAPISWYIVSFPHRNVSENLLKSYHFLFNSEYTKRWARHFWGSQIQGTVVYPIRMLRSSGSNRPFSQSNKRKIILSVGRFFPFEHSKNQLEIAKAFRAVVAGLPEARQWKLVLAGSLDYSHKDHVAYFDSVKRCLNGLNAELLPNVERDDLEKNYSNATIYIHATGMGHNKEHEPEKFEHFGITVVEAMLHGCIPVVFDTGGPAELVKSLEAGYCYFSSESLQATLKQLVIRDFCSLTSESSVVHQRGTNFVNAELSKRLPFAMLESDSGRNNQTNYNLYTDRGPEADYECR